MNKCNYISAPRLCLYGVNMEKLTQHWAHDIPAGDSYLSEMSGGLFLQGWKGGTTALLLVRATDFYIPRRKKKATASFSIILQWAKYTVRMFLRWLVETLHPCACAPIVLLAGVISCSVESTFRFLRHWLLLHVWIPGKGWKGCVLILTQYRPPR